MKELLQNAQHIVIFTHMAPDGDAMGSALAIYHWLGGKPEVIVPNAFPAFFNWMPGADKIHVYEKEKTACDTIIAAADLFICTDFNDPKRIGPMGDKMLANPCPKILIDHHLNPTDFADEVHSHPEASSSCEIVYQIIRSNPSIPSTPNKLNIATCIYTGLMTDTGNFSFNSTRAELYDIIAELLRARVQKDDMYDAD